MRILTLSLFLISACSNDTKFNNGSAELTSLVDSFSSYYGVEVNYPVYFVDKFNNGISFQVGGCYNFPKRVEVSRAYEHSDKLRILVYHELGHCSLHLTHYDSDTDIMNSVIHQSVLRDFEYYKHKMLLRVK